MQLDKSEVEAQGEVPLFHISLAFCMKLRAVAALKNVCMLGLYSIESGTFTILTYIIFCYEM